MTEEQSEQSVRSCFCVVYKLVDQDWVVTGEGWAQCHLYKDNADGTHRIVGWSVNDSKVVINCNVSVLCKYKKKSDDFHKFQDERGNVYGFGFYKKEDSLVEASNFMDAVLSVISGSSKPPPALPPKNDTLTKKGSVLNPDPYNHQLESKKDQPYQSTKLPLGKLQILPEKNARQANSDKGISDPFQVYHNRHVEYDNSSRKYEGLPPEWEHHLKQQFGLPPSRLECEKLPEYEHRIPCILIQMKKYLFENQGLESEGIFRIAPDATESLFVKKQLNENTFRGCSDINTIANLVKVWYRELPEHVLDQVDGELIKSADTTEKAGDIVTSIREPYKSLLLWLLDLCVEVSQHADVNKMTAQNLAIVIAPNLFTPSQSDAMTAVMFSQKAVKFLHKAIEWRQQTTA